ncbi:MAG: hypothetical protein K0S07_205 [Chlamydiales bacterium]|jgi:hypothetical protein|nr:hypothetical protein [Chlamydiales bacterium]
MLGTYGLCSINCTTFNQSLYDHRTWPKAERDLVFKVLKVRNAVFDTLGYIPGVSILSGLGRVAAGALMLHWVLRDGNPDANEGAYSGRFYFEARNQAIAQIARGILEISVVGIAVNIALGCVGTFAHLPEILNESCNFYPYLCEGAGTSPHKNPDFAYGLLNLV